QVVLEARFGDLIVPVAAFGVSVPGVAIHPVQGEHAHPGRQGLARGRYHSAFPGGHVLRGVKAKGNGVATWSIIAGSTDLTPQILSSSRVRSVFHHGEAVAA